jgi:hypothetical protein
MEQMDDQESGEEDPDAGMVGQMSWDNNNL